MRSPQPWIGADRRPAAVPTGRPAPRLDIHNNATDESAAAQHQCGMRHLATGRICRLPERHPGGCRFTG